MSQLEVNKVIPQSGTNLQLGEAGDTVDVSNATLTANINASSLTSGTIPDARFPATLPALDGSNLTNIQIAGGYTACDSITVTNTDTFALTAGGSPVSPESANNCIVSLNGVIQAPGNSYTISGSNIVFSSALSAGSDVIDFITVLGTALNVGTVSDGTITTAKLASGVLPTNTPAFHATTSTTSANNTTFTTAVYSVEDRDTDSLYDTSTGIFTVTASTTGYYYFYASIGTALITANRMQINLVKNGSTYLLTSEAQEDTSGYPAWNISGVIPLLSSGDNVRVNWYQNSGGAIALSGELNKNFFGAYKLIGV